MLFYLTKTLHLAITAFVVFGWLYSQENVLLVHVIFVPVLIVHWKTNNNRCVLSNIEAWLQGVDVATQEQAPFIRWLFSLFTSREFQERTLSRVTYGVMGLAFCLSGLRLVLG
jgi:hypothetical protein